MSPKTTPSAPTTVAKRSVCRPSTFTSLPSAYLFAGQPGVCVKQPCPRGVGQDEFCLLSSPQRHCWSRRRRSVCLARFLLMCPTSAPLQAETSPSTPPTCRQQARLRSSCGGTMPKVKAVSVTYPGVDPAGLFADRAGAAGVEVELVAVPYAE